MEKAGVIACKVGSKLALNAALPGLGSAVDFADAIKDVCNGDYLNALINTGSGVFDLISLGMFGAAKEAAKEAGKNAAVASAKETAKATTKDIGKAAAKDIAKGGSKQVVSATARIAADNAKKEIGRKFGKELGKGMISDFTEEAFKKSASKAAIKGAGMGLIGSGGKEITAEMLEGAAFNFFSELSTKTSREAFKTSTSSAAKKAIVPVADKFFGRDFGRELVKSSVTGVMKFGGQRH